MSKKKFYVVWRGKKPGIYTSWQVCKRQIDGFEKSAYKSFSTLAQAELAFKNKYEDYIGKKPLPKKITKIDLQKYGKPILESISVDAACSGNPGPGGWGAVIFDKENNQKNISGNEKNTTNNRMELLAAIMALKKIKNNSDVVIYTDSIYVKNGITEWVLKWKENGWKNSNKEPVKNKDLWEKLDNLCEQNTINWKWVKGHASNKYNNLADELATKAIKN